MFILSIALSIKLLRFGVDKTDEGNIEKHQNEAQNTSLIKMQGGSKEIKMKNNETVKEFILKEKKKK